MAMSRLEARMAEHAEEWEDFTSGIKAALDESKTVRQPNSEPDLGVTAMSQSAAARHPNREAEWFQGKVPPTMNQLSGLSRATDHEAIRRGAADAVRQLQNFSRDHGRPEDIEDEFRSFQEKDRDYSVVVNDHEAIRSVAAYTQWHLRSLRDESNLSYLQRRQQPWKSYTLTRDNGNLGDPMPYWHEDPPLTGDRKVLSEAAVSMTDRDLASVGLRIQRPIGYDAQQEAIAKRAERLYQLDEYENQDDTWFGLAPTSMMDVQMAPRGSIRDHAAIREVARSVAEELPCLFSARKTAENQDEPTHHKRAAESSKGVAQQEAAANLQLVPPSKDDWQSRIAANLEIADAHLHTAYLKQRNEDVPPAAQIQAMLGQDAPKPPEHRVAEDGVAYTMQEFRDEYGDSWQAHWESAQPHHLEQRNKQEVPPSALNGAKLVNGVQKTPHAQSVKTAWAPQRIAESPVNVQRPMLTANSRTTKSVPPPASKNAATEEPVLGRYANIAGIARDMRRKKREMAAH